MEEWPSERLRTIKRLGESDVQARVRSSKTVEDRSFRPT